MISTPLFSGITITSSISSPGGGTAAPGGTVAARALALARAFGAGDGAKLGEGDVLLDLVGVGAEGGVLVLGVLGA
jgi:hypothetical protein